MLKPKDRLLYFQTAIEDWLGFSKVIAAGAAETICCSSLAQVREAVATCREQLRGKDEQMAQQLAVKASQLSAKDERLSAQDAKIARLATDGQQMQRLSGSSRRCVRSWKRSWQRSAAEEERASVRARFIIINGSFLT